MDSPAIPVAAASFTLSATCSGSTANPPSKSAFTGTFTAAATTRRCSSTSSSVTLIVRATQRPGETGARRRQRLEAHLLQGPRAPRIPRVRHHEAPGGVQAAERLGLARQSLSLPAPRLSPLRGRHAVARARASHYGPGQQRWPVRRSGGRVADHNAAHPPAIAAFSRRARWSRWRWAGRGPAFSPSAPSRRSTSR